MAVYRKMPAVRDIFTNPARDFPTPVLEPIASQAYVILLALYQPMGSHLLAAEQISSLGESVLNHAQVGKYHLHCWYYDTIRESLSEEFID